MHGGFSTDRRESAGRLVSSWAVKSPLTLCGQYGGLVVLVLNVSTGFVSVRVDSATLDALKAAKPSLALALPQKFPGEEAEAALGGALRRAPLPTAAAARRGPAAGRRGQS